MRTVCVFKEMLERYLHSRTTAAAVVSAVSLKCLVWLFNHHLHGIDCGTTMVTERGQAVLQCPQKKKKKKSPNVRSNRQLEAPLPLNFSSRIFRNSALAPNFSFHPKFGEADMGSLVHSRECGKATAVSMISFHPDLVAEICKYGSGRFRLWFLVLQPCIFFYCCRRRSSYVLFLPVFFGRSYVRSSAATV